MKPPSLILHVHRSNHFCWAGNTATGTMLGGSMRGKTGALMAALGNAAERSHDQGGAALPDAVWLPVFSVSSAGLVTVQWERAEPGVVTGAVVDACAAKATPARKERKRARRKG